LTQPTNPSQKLILNEEIGFFVSPESHKGINMSQQTGFAAQTQAQEYLQRQGLTWVASNYRCKMGEIDLIMRDKTHLIFVEVRARSSAAFGGAIASITPMKCKKICQTALHYLMVHRLFEQQPIRFDVVALEGRQQQITWIQNAFTGNY
jgi:putative endonuclease